MLHGLRNPPVLALSLGILCLAGLFAFLRGPEPPSDRESGAPAVTPSPHFPHAGSIRHRARQRLSADGTIPDGALMHAIAQREALVAAQSAMGGANLSGGGLQWDELGPTNIGGRIRSILVHPGDPDVMWVGAVSGGVWKTEDGAQSWRPLDDFLPVLAVCCMAMDPADPDRLYAGTGEAYFSPLDGVSNVAPTQGAGIFVSDDGGDSWSQLPSTAGPEWHYVFRIAVSPVNSSHLLVGTLGAIQVSLDAGLTWTLVPAGSLRVSDLGFDPTNGARAIASAYSLFPYVGGLQYTEDGGATWNLSALPGPAGRIEIKYAPSDPSIVYASADENAGQLWRSSDGGKTFALVNDNSGFLANGQGNYDNALWVDPTDPAHLIVGGIDLYQSFDAGATLTKISDWRIAAQDARVSVHADQHVIVHHPDYDGAGNREVYFGCDGGIYRATDVMAVSTTSGWDFITQGLAITQCYSGAVSQDGKTMYVGTQDNNTLRSFGFVRDWTPVVGGDGGFIAIDPRGHGDPLRPDVAYEGGTFGQIWRIVDGQDELICGLKTDFATWKDPPYLIEDAKSLDANFIPPIALDPHKPHRLYVAGRSLWRSRNPRAPLTDTTGPRWRSVKDGEADLISAITIDPLDPDRIWVGHNDGELYLSENATSAQPTWVQKDSGMPSRWLSCIAVDPGDTDRITVSFMGYESNNLWRSEDGGNTWTDVTGAAPFELPDIPVSWVTLDGTDLYLATDLGVFVSRDDAQTWTTSNEGPANVIVDQLTISLQRELYAFTFGRGVFRATLAGAPGPPRGR